MVPWWAWLPLGEKGTFGFFILLSDLSSKSTAWILLSCPIQEMGFECSSVERTETEAEGVTGHYGEVEYLGT